MGYSSTSNAGLQMAARITLAAVLAFVSAAAALAEPDIRKGREFAGLWCSACHKIGPKAPERGPGPPFEALANNPRYTAGYLRQWITTPHSTMPHFSFSKEKLDDLVAYIHSLRPENVAPSSGDSRSLAQYARGSGFFVSPNGHIVTADHVVETCTRITAQVPGATAREVQKIASDHGLDIAVLKYPGRAPNFARFAPETGFHSGERVISFGFPLIGTLSSGGTLSVGHIASDRGVGDNPDQFQITAGLLFGASGAPVLDSAGRVIGVAISRLMAMSHGQHKGVEGANFAVRGSRVQGVMFAAGVVPAFQARGRDLQVADLASAARSFAVQVTCLR